MTPAPLARALVRVIHPRGAILEPCAGDGAFVSALRRYGKVRWCETDASRRCHNGRSFFECSERVDWIVTNPPWSQFRAFLEHSLRLADHVALLATLNHWWTRLRRDLVRDAGFGIARIVEFDTPADWPSTGFQMGMVVLSRGHRGACVMERLEDRRRVR
jgi:hypothetical protein